MSANLYYFSSEHSHSCECGGWKHDAVDCEYSPEYPCPLCDVEMGLVPGASGSTLSVDPFEDYSRLAYEGE